MVDLSDLIERLGEHEAFSILKEYVEKGKSGEENVLTIVVNKGVHHLPEKSLRGTVFYASEGNLDFSSPESVEKEFGRVLVDVTKILKEKSWKQVFVLPFGPCALSMQIKLLVYRITRIESIEIFHLGEGEYMNLEINQRELIVGAE